MTTQTSHSHLTHDWCEPPDSMAERHPSLRRAGEDAFKTWSYSGLTITICSKLSDTKHSDTGHFYIRQNWKEKQRMVDGILEA